MEHAERIEVVLTKLKNALAESEALKKRILERKREALDSNSEGSERSESPRVSEGSEGSEGSDLSDTEVAEVEKPIKKTWCCCFRKQKLN
jgi:hypothetical protein